MATSGLSESSVVKVYLHQHNFTWTIVNFTEIPFGIVDNDCLVRNHGKPLTSELFQPGDLQYGLRLKLYPYLVENCRNSYVAVSLMWNGRNPNLYSIKNMMSIIDSCGNIVHSTKMSEDITCRKLISRQYLLDEKDNLLPNDTLKVRCDIEIVYNIETQSSNYFNSVNASEVHKDLISLWESKICSDVKFICDGTELRAHKAILSARSPVFQNMFKHNMLENQESVVNIVDVKAPVMKELLHYIYGKEIGNLLADNIYLELFTAADKYGLLDLKQHCVSIMVKQLNMDTVSKVAILAELHDIPELFRLARDFVKSNALQLLV